MLGSGFKQKSPLILVVNDDRSLRLVMRDAMEKEGYSVAEAESGEDCLETCQQLKPDLVLLDAAMLEMDGFTCCLRLHSLLGDDCPPILMITLPNDEASVDRTFEVGATDYITKPIHWVTLRHRVRCLVQEHCLLQEQTERVERERLLEQQLEIAYQELQRLTSIDTLTQVANRRFFDDYLQQEWKRLLREQQPLSLVLADIDFFKAYNDTYGHQAGDECLKKVAKIVHHFAQRPADLVARYTGEEFAVILPSTPAKGAIQIAEAIRSKVKAHAIAHAGSPVSKLLTLSLGVASLIPSRNTSVDRLISEAEEALYQAKLGLRDRVVINLGNLAINTVHLNPSTPLIWGGNTDNVAEFYETS